MKYVDLGLPSGTLWADTNKRGFFAFDEALEKFSNSLPTVEQWKELMEYCAWWWDEERKGRIVTGMNGNSIFLPAAGYSGRDGLLNAGSYGYYWSSSLNTDVPNYAWDIYFGSDNVVRYDSYRFYGQSIRLIKVK